MGAALRIAALWPGKTPLPALGDVFTGSLSPKPETTWNEINLSDISWVTPITTSRQGNVTLPGTALQS
jgi:hypothetical protein